MNPTEQTLASHLAYLKLHYLKEHFQALADQAAREQWSALLYLARLIEGEALARQDRAIQKRLKEARFPMVKTLEQFDWSWPKKVNRAQVQNLFRLGWVNEKANVVLMGGCGLGIMPGTGLCRAGCDLPMDSVSERPSARHNPALVVGYFCGDEFTIRLMNDTIINLTGKKRGSRQRWPPLRAHRIVSGETRRFGLHARPCRISSTLLCKDRPLAASTKGAPMVAQ